MCSVAFAAQNADHICRSTRMKQIPSLIDCISATFLTPLSLNAQMTIRNLSEDDKRAKEREAMMVKIAQTAYLTAVSVTCEIGIRISAITC